jgi:hypothetical protein
MTDTPWVVTALTAVVTAGFGIWQFTVQQRQANRLPFLQKQLELCFQATDTVSRLASETDPAEWEKARQAFWQLYWGPLSIVEDRAVESAMVHIGRLVPAQPIDAPELPMVVLAVPSYRLAHAARELVLKSWNVRLPALEGQRQQ